MQFRLMNGKRVEASVAEVTKIVSTHQVFANPYWRFSGLMAESEVLAYLEDRADARTLEKLAGYILTVAECTSFAAYLLAKAEGQGQEQESLDYNLPALKKLRQLRANFQGTGTVHEMLSICREQGIDPL